MALMIDPMTGRLVRGASIPTLQPLRLGQPARGQLGGPGQPTPGQMGRAPRPRNIWKDPSQPLSGKRAPTKRTGGKQPARAIGTRAGMGAYEGPYYGGKPMFSAAARAKLRPGSSLASQMRQLQGGRRGGARTLLARGRLDPMSKMQMGRGGFPGRRQVRSFISGR